MPILNRVAELHDEVTGWRRHLHTMPELLYDVHQTAAFVEEKLKEFGCDEVIPAIGRTGVVGSIKGSQGDGATIGLRADMDALPLTEITGKPYASLTPGKMHACGHDGHTAMLLGAAQYLAETRNFKGSVAVIFQPAEENLPNGEIGGARLMGGQGVLENPKPDAVFGLHVGSGLPVGQIRYVPGPASASSDTLKMIVTGKQAHGAMPWNGVDPITVSAQIITAMQTLVSRETNIIEAPSVLTIGTINGGLRQNIIPESIEMTGTFRTYDDEVRGRIKGRLTELASSIAEGMNATAEVTWEPNGYPSIVNDPALIDRMAPTLARVAGDGARLGTKGAASEDFSYFAQKAPGMFFSVGISTPGEEKGAAPNHSPHFKVDEAGLLYGLRAMLHIVADYTGSAQV